MSAWQIVEPGWVTARYHRSPPRCPQPSCLCCLWPGVCRSPLPSQHTFMGIFLSFPLRLLHAVPLLPALLRHPSSPINLSWSGLQLLCLSPHHQLSRPERNTSFCANPESLLPFPKSPPVRHSRKLMLQAASAVRSCSCGPPWVEFGHLRHQQVSCRLGGREGFLVCPAERRSGSPHRPTGHLQGLLTQCSDCECYNWVPCQPLESSFMKMLSTGHVQ